MLAGMAAGGGAVVGARDEPRMADERDAFEKPLYTSGPTPIGVAAVAWLARDEILLATVNPQAVYQLNLDDEGLLSSVVSLFDTGGPALAVTRGRDGCIYVGDVSTIWRIKDGRCE